MSACSNRNDISPRDKLYVDLMGQFGLREGPHYKFDVDGNLELSPLGGLPRILNWIIRHPDVYWLITEKGGGLTLDEKEWDDQLEAL
jgi:hypothetical protein